jgi:hypothetical protein
MMSHIQMSEFKARHFDCELQISVTHVVKIFDISPQPWAGFSRSPWYLLIAVIIYLCIPGRNRQSVNYDP